MHARIDLECFVVGDDGIRIPVLLLINLSEPCIKLCPSPRWSGSNGMIVCEQLLGFSQIGFAVGQSPAELLWSEHRAHSAKQPDSRVVGSESNRVRHRRS